MAGKAMFKLSWKWALIGGLSGYAVVHPLVMITGGLMHVGAFDLTVQDIILMEIKHSFMLHMLPWSFAYAFFGAIVGTFYGRIREIERDLRQSENLYRSVVEDQIEYICRFYPDGGCSFANEALCNLLGVSFKEMTGRSIFDVLFQDRQEVIEEKIHSLSILTSKTQLEQSIKAGDGSDQWISWIFKAIFDEDGRLIEYQCVGRDITALKGLNEELRQYKNQLEKLVEQRTGELNQLNERLQKKISEKEAAERSLLESEKKYRILFESAPMGIALTTYDGRVLAANAQLLAMFGYLPSEANQILAADLYCNPEDRQRILRELKERPGSVNTEIQLKRKDQSVFYASATLLAFVLDQEPVILSVLTDITRRKKAYEALEQSEVELRRLSEKLMHVQEEERKRIANELHDSIGQLLHAIKYSVESAARQLRAAHAERSLIETLEGLMPLIKDASSEVRRIVMALRPSLLDDLGILATIKWFCREYHTIYTGIQVKAELFVEESDVPVRLKVVIFRILQEAFNNTAKHSHASQVRLRLEKSDDNITLTIEDNGKGFYPPSPTHHGTSEKGFGMSSMRERAIASGGAFHISSVLGAGTHLRVVWPLDA